MYYSFFENLNLPELLYYVEYIEAFVGITAFIAVIQFIFVLFIFKDSEISNFIQNVLVIASAVFCICWLGITVTLPNKAVVINWMFMMEDENKIEIPVEIKRNLKIHLMNKNSKC